MFGKLIRLLTFNYLTLGWWFPPLVPKWVKARRKMNKPAHWDTLIELKVRFSNKIAMRKSLGEAKALMQQCVPWYSPKEINLALKYLAKHRKVHLPCLDEDQERFYSALRANVSISKQVWRCCGGEWQYGDCGCVRPDLSSLPFPFKPQRTVRSD